MKKKLQKQILSAIWNARYMAALTAPCRGQDARVAADQAEAAYWELWGHRAQEMKRALEARNGG